MHPILKAYAMGGSAEHIQDVLLPNLVDSDYMQVDIACFHWLLRVRPGKPFSINIAFELIYGSRMFSN